MVAIMEYCQSSSLVQQNMPLIYFSNHGYCIRIIITPKNKLLKMAGGVVNTDK